ncbi:hypothetical protein [Allobranchiibius sp. CTAmp26]|uniref:hypothetical protein n=1 Tax=Allobranchiibius sp. CTAmp26 TaxID=2815214 RepID=UPI001AA12232|nr:hypothetical protein [Allobranchiibius sp. CTAmp26]MBO1753538.1 hypothetical protein [Allobranchiibius sp. CTAmp26]
MTESRRRPRRAVRPPTGTPRDEPAEPTDDLSVSADDTDEGWSGAGETAAGARSSDQGEHGGRGDRDERWWREQRPPHWE